MNFLHKRENDAENSYAKNVYFFWNFQKTGVRPVFLVYSKLLFEYFIKKYPKGVH